MSNLKNVTTRRTDRDRPHSTVHRSRSDDFHPAELRHSTHGHSCAPPMRMSLTPTPVRRRKPYGIGHNHKHGTPYDRILQPKTSQGRARAAPHRALSDLPHVGPALSPAIFRRLAGKRTGPETSHFSLEPPPSASAHIFFFASISSFTKARYEPKPYKKMNQNCTLTPEGAAGPSIPSMAFATVKTPKSPV